MDGIIARTADVGWRNSVIINLNENIKAKLNDRGKDIYYHQYDLILPFCPHIKPSYPKVDKDGYTEFQIWHFMELYGEHIGMGRNPVLESMNVIYEGEHP